MSFYFVQDDREEQVIPLVVTDNSFIVKLRSRDEVDSDLQHIYDLLIEQLGEEVLARVATDGGALVGDYFDVAEVEAEYTDIPLSHFVKLLRIKWAIEE